MKTVIEMAREARLCADGPTLEALERFAALVREDEREACAKLCEGLCESGEDLDCGHEYAAAIRARGE